MRFLAGGELLAPWGMSHSLHGCDLGAHMKDATALLSSLRDISSRLNELASDNGRHALDADAIVDLNMARSSVDKLIKRVERVLPST